jgi:hypothetical protein
MLATYMGEERMDRAISSPLPKRNMCQVNNQNCTGREFKRKNELDSYEMDGVMIDKHGNILF